MKKRIVLLLAMLATMVVFVVGFTIGSSAQTYDVSTASDFTSKINSAASGDTINVTADITVGTAHTITKNLTVTSSNGSTVTATVDNLFSVGSDASTSGNLTIDGNLTLTYPTKGTIVRMVNGTLTVQGNASLISSWTTVRMATDGGLVATSHVYVKDNALVEATIENENDYAFYINGVGGKANLHIQGGTVRHTAGYGISFPAGNIEISGGTVTAMYGIFVWYDAGSAVKTINVSGGTVEGSQSGIYFKDNTKNCTLTVSGGTVRGDVHAIHYVANKDSSNNAININGGTVTAAGQTIFLYRCTALPMTVTGGTIEATSGGLTIYGAELKGDLTLNVSETARITATVDNTINVTMPGNTSTYPGKLVALIEGGIISAGGEHAINVQNGSVTMTGGTVSAGSVAIYANKEGGLISISGGTVTSGANTIAFDAAGTRTLNISGTAQIISTGNVAILGTASATPTIIISGGTITTDGDFCIDTRGGTVRIEGGTLTANSTWGFYVRGNVAYTITGGTMKSTGALFGFSGASGASLNIMGGTFIINGSGNGAFVARPGATSGSTITIDGGLFVNSSTANIENVLVAASLNSENTITVTSGKVLYKEKVANIITGTEAPKTETEEYDVNGNGVIDEDETFYVYGELPEEIINNVATNTTTGESYLSLEEAIKAASKGDTIDVIADLYLLSNITITKTLTLTSSNGSTITATAENIFSVGLDASTSGNLTIDGNLKITYAGGTIVRMVNGTLTVQGDATLTSGWTTIRMASDGGVAADCYVYIKGNALIEATSTDESNNVIYVNDGSKANLFIQGGTVRNTLGRGISFPGGKITVSGGTLTAKYGMYVWYDAGSAIKTINISGGTVEGSITGIYFNTNTKNCTLTVSGGTVRGTAHAIHYRADKSSANNLISISGGTLTAQSQTIFFNHCSAVTMKATGGKIVAGDNSVIKVDAEATDVTLQVSSCVMILGGTSEGSQIISNDAGTNCTVTVENGRFLYGENVKTLWDGTDASETEKVPYDLNGDGEIGEGETFYIKFFISVTSTKYSGTMEKGAAVQISEDGNGLKFTTVFTASSVKSLNNKAVTGSEITYGTLILPTDLLMQLESYDSQSLVALIGAEGCYHLVGGVGARLSLDEDQNLILQAAIFGIKDKSVSYSAISYTCLKSKYESTYYFTAYDLADNARSARQVAEAAIADTETTYTAAQTAVLQTYLAPIDSLRLPAVERTFVLLHDARKEWWL